MCFFRKKKKDKNINKEVVETPKKKKATRVYHVVKKEGKWGIKYAGGEKNIKLFDKKEEAVEYAKTLSENQNGAYLVHTSKGKNKGRIQ